VKAQIIEKNEAGASGTGTFPSWSLGTRESSGRQKNATADFGRW